MSTVDTPQEQQQIGLVVNPSRDELAGRVGAALVDRGASVEEFRPSDASDLGDAVRDAIERGVGLVAAVGGDGTQRTVAAELIDHPEVALAVVPGGTVNLLARVLGIDDLERAIDTALSGGRRRIDVGRLGDRAFLLNSSTGWDASTIEATDDDAKRFGRLGYAAAAVTRWRQEPARHVTVEIDGDRWFDGPAKTVLVLNAGQRGSASIQLAPDAELDDGRLDVVVLRQDDLRALIRAAWAIIRGHEPRPSDVCRTQGSEIRVAWEREVPVQVDGDDVGRGRTFDYDVRPASLSVAAAPAG